MLLFSTLLTAQRFPHAFATRTTKDAELQRVLGTTEVIQSKQVHGSRVVEADAPPGTEADAIVARSTRAAPQAIIAVGVRVADCVPVLIAAAKSGDVAAVHAGWRGVVAEVVPAAVTALGGGPVFAAIGPCIGACCFEVGSDVAARIAGTCKEKRVVVWEARGKAYVDLRAAVRAQLLSLGIADEQIHDVPGCTTHDPERFHSYRRDGERSGRMLAAIATRR